MLKADIFNIKRGCCACWLKRAKLRGVFSRTEKHRGDRAENMHDLMVNYGMASEAAALYPDKANSTYYQPQYDACAPRDLSFLAFGEASPGGGHGVVTGVIPAQHMSPTLYDKIKLMLPFLSHTSEETTLFRGGGERVELGQIPLLRKRFLSVHPAPGEPMVTRRTDATHSVAAQVMHATNKLQVREFTLSGSQTIDVEAVRILVFGTGRGLTTNDFDVVIGSKYCYKKRL
jgi:hypothetical protein